jgi:hypothetical protein
MLGNFGIAEAHEIGCDTASQPGEPLDRASPLEAIERSAVQEQRCLARAAFDISDPAEAEISKAPLARKAAASSGCNDSATTVVRPAASAAPVSCKKCLRFIALACGQRGPGRERGRPAVEHRWMIFAACPDRRGRPG